MLTQIFSFFRSSRQFIYSRIMIPEWMSMTIQIIVEIAKLIIRPFQIIIETIWPKKPIITLEKYVEEVCNALDLARSLVQKIGTPLCVFPVDKCVRNFMEACIYPSAVKKNLEEFLKATFNATLPRVNFSCIDDQLPIDDHLMKDCVMPILDLIEKLELYRDCVEKTIGCPYIDLFEDKKTPCGYLVKCDQIKKMHENAIPLANELFPQGIPKVSLKITYSERYQ